MALWHSLIWTKMQHYILVLLRSQQSKNCWNQMSQQFPFLSLSLSLSSFVCVSLSLSSLNCLSHCVDNSPHKTPSRKHVLDPWSQHLPYSKTLLSLCGWATKQERCYTDFLFIDFVNLGVFLTLKMEPNLSFEMQDSLKLIYKNLSS